MNESNNRGTPRPNDNVAQEMKYQPFTKGEGSPPPDIILRSSDNNDFYCHKTLLSLASPFFANMYSLPQNDQDSPMEVPVVPVAEEAHILFSLLSVCDPRCRPSLEPRLDHISAVLYAAEKYDMAGVILTVGEMLGLRHDVINQQPLRVFAIAVRYQLHDIAELAARGTLGIPVDEWPDTPELRSIPASTLQQLYRYYFACSKAATASVADLSWLEDREFIWFSTSHLGNCAAGFNVNLNRYCKDWWMAYMNQLEAEIRKAPGHLGSHLSNGGATPPKAALDCPTCRSYVHIDLRRFNDLLLAQVQHRIDQVDIPQWE